MEINFLLTQPESKILEFKSNLSSLQPILKTIVAFANTAGGTLVIGRSPEGKVLGLDDIFKEEEKLANAIADNIRPSILPEIEMTTAEGKTLLMVKVAHWKGPFYLKQQGIPGGVYIRLSSTSRPAGPELLAELQRSISHISYDEQPLTDLSANSLDLEKATKIFQSIGKDLNEEKLRSLGILIPHVKRLVPSIGGLILFGKPAERRQFVPDARISCARFKGKDKAEFIDRYELEGTILDAIEMVPKFIARNTRLSAEFHGMYRKNVEEYPPLAVREVLVNALAHTDYSIIGSHTQIAIYNDRLEIQNPGMLPFGFTLDDLKAGISRVRNRVIARVFSELGFMEEWGSGYKRILEACHSEYPSPEWHELESVIRVVFYPHDKTNFLGEEEVPIYQASHHLHPRHENILNLFPLGKCLTFTEIFRNMPEKISERTLRYDLALLKNLGFLISIGKGRATVWKKILN